jgi:hypothetical protein
MKQPSRNTATVQPIFAVGSMYRDVDGNEGVTRIYGLKDRHTQVLRVTGRPVVS